MSRKHWRVKPDIPKPGTGMSKPTIHHSPQWFSERIATLEAQKSSIWDQYQAAEARVKVLETLEPEYKRLVSKLEELEGELAEAIKIIYEAKSWIGNGAARHTIQQFLEKHK